MEHIQYLDFDLLIERAGHTQSFVRRADGNNV